MKKQKHPFLAAGLKVLFGVMLLAGLGQYEKTGPMLLALALGLGLLFWSVWPFIRKHKKTAGTISRPETQQGLSSEPDNVEYPFSNMGMARALTPADYIVFDVETTGFSPRDDKIIELAAIKIQGGAIARFHSLVNPGRRIPQRSQAIHGICDSDVAGAPTFLEILPELDAFLDPSLPIVGHNVLFDLRFLWWEYHDAGCTFAPRQFVDTYKLAKKMLPGRESYALASLIKDYGLIDGEQTHRSESDVDATLALYEFCRRERQI